MNRIRVLASWFILVYTLYAFNIEYRWGMYAGLIAFYILRYKLDNAAGLKQVFTVSKKVQLILLICYLIISSVFVYLLVGSSELYQMFMGNIILVLLVFSIPVLPFVIKAEATFFNELNKNT